MYCMYKYEICVTLLQPKICGLHKYQKVHLTIDTCIRQNRPQNITSISNKTQKKLNGVLNGDPLFIFIHSSF